MKLAHWDWEEHIQHVMHTVYSINAPCMLVRVQSPTGCALSGQQAHLVVVSGTIRCLTKIDYACRPEFPLRHTSESRRPGPGPWWLEFRQRGTPPVLYNYSPGRRQATALQHIQAHLHTLPPHHSLRQ